MAAVRRLVADGSPTGTALEHERIAAGECPACRPRYVAGWSPEPSTVFAHPRAEPRLDDTLYCPCCETLWGREGVGWVATVGGGLQITGAPKPVPAGRTIDSSWFLIEPISSVEGPEEALADEFRRLDNSFVWPAEDDLVADATESMLACYRGRADAAAELGRIELEHRLDPSVADRWRETALAALDTISRLREATRPPARGRRGGVSISRVRFEELVAEALDLIPEGLAVAIENVAVVVEDQHASRRLFGLYEGIPLTRRGSHYSAAAPDKITIYQQTICESCRSEADVVEQVRQTVVHEVAHHFGISDPRLSELGW